MNRNYYDIQPLMGTYEVLVACHTIMDEHWLNIKCQQTDLVEFLAACGGRSGTQRYGPTGQPPHRRT